MSLQNNAITRYFSESLAEIKKVSWPSRKETLRHTLLVIGISLGVALFLGAADYVLSLGLEELIKWNS